MKTPKPATEMPPLHEFKTVTVGTVKPEIVSGYTITRAQFKEAVEETFDTMAETDHEEQADAVRAIIESTVGAVDRFPLGTWMDVDRGCGCIVGEALVATDAIERDALMLIESDRERDEDVPRHIGDLIGKSYPFELARALLWFGTEVDTAVGCLVDDPWPLVKIGATYWDEPIYADRVVFISDEAA
jgi:hypothetical protein